MNRTARLASLTATLTLLAGSGAAIAMPAENPAHNSTPSPATVRACLAPRASTRSCDAHALLDVDSARRGEGVGPMSLPGDYQSLSLPERLLALVDLERVDRGLSPVVGLTRQLDAAARQAAVAEADPTGPEGFSWGSNWAGGTRSTVFDDFSWMYDDGFGSQNLACRSPSDSGCWGHRDNILAAFEAPVAMGAAAVGVSLTELLVARYQPVTTGADTLLMPTWAQIARTLPIGVSPRSVHLTNGARTARLRIWASGEAMNVTAAIAGATSARGTIARAIGAGGATRGAASWSVVPTHCQLAAGFACTLTVTAPARHRRATLVLAGPNGRQTVKLT